ncbi:MarR family winged helix-turn-helix transcriptional regulator [Paracoccus shanxieyensis]|uniref:MarR family transcriptional regulator n=1 Tax=Paracoccus shanxieyensis TaxID=2675752 RepID=A0A6L6IVD2_9RHOB|nr:MarR family transcriptional regulator [Paracoccus shanxieyensis]MTH63010.1 MarR family transcriptional regulator [Paracoccus shanxieyensis]MTH85906.1 MarR family transcriptional regulator [Paracoccus shanxieyensis]
MPDKTLENQPATAEFSADALAASLFSEVFIADQLAREIIGKALPKGMQISHFSVLNLLAHVGAERSPAELAEAFHVTRGAMTNTLSRLEWAGHIHIRPDWDDARRKFVSISPAGRAARDAALAAFMPRIADVVRDVGAERVRAALPVLRLLRKELAEALRQNGR